MEESKNINKLFVDEARKLRDEFEEIVSELSRPVELL